MADKTKIVFSDGHELQVDEQPSEVLDRLARNEPFTKFKTSGGTDVHVVADRVAYIEQVPEPSPSAPVFGAKPGPSRHRID